MTLLFGMVDDLEMGILWFGMVDDYEMGILWVGIVDRTIPRAVDDGPNISSGIGQ